MLPKRNITVALVLALALLGASSNQCISRGFIVSNIGTLFTWSGSAPSGWSGSNRMASIGDFEAFVRNNGSCGSSTSQLITYAVATGCAVNSSTISPPTDPWFINGSLDWTTVSGSASFTASTDSLTPPPSGAKDAVGTSSSYTIEQALNGGAQIIAGTHVTVSFDSAPQSLTATYFSDSGCSRQATSTATGSTTIELLNSSGGQVFAQTDSAPNVWAHTPVSGTIPSNGVYYVAVHVSAQTVNYTYWYQTIHGCVSASGSVSAGGRATNIAAGN